MKLRYRLTKDQLMRVLRDGGVIGEASISKNVEISIVWENNTTTPLFEPIHGADGLLVTYEEDE